MLLTLDIVTIDAAGDGVARHGSMRVHVPFAIPGERIRARVDRRRGHEAWAHLEEIVTPSPHRVRPHCAHFGPPDGCGGCTWQHIAYPEQLRLKTRLVQTLIEEALGPEAPAVRATLPSTPIDAPWGYRRKVHFVFANAGRTLVMGHYTRGTRRVFAATECPVHDPRGNAFAFRLHEACAAAGVAAAQASSPRAGPDRRGTLRSLALRVGAERRPHAPEPETGSKSPELMATLVVTSTADKRLRQATRRALDSPEGPQSFHLNIHARQDPYIFGRETRHVRGPHHLRERVAGTTFLLSPTAFFQTNVDAADLLVRLVLSALPPGGPVLDLYAGVGLFALPLASRGDRVLAIEENRAATEDGTLSLRANGIDPDRCRFVAARVESALAAVRPGDAVHVVLDPPREGCDPSVLQEIFGRLRPARVAYVSCNPEALARDLLAAVRHGYRAEPLQPVDMFPHTAHVETLAVLAPSAGAAARRGWRRAAHVCSSGSPRRTTASR